MNKGTVLALLVVVLGGGYGIGRLVVKDKGGAATASAKTPSAAAKEIAGAGDGVDRVRVPLEGAAKGPADAKVNIVTFSDFQCPFCSRVVPTLAQIEKEYGNKVRVFFRHNPLPFHADAPLASEAAIAAEAAGEVLGDARQAVRQPAEPEAPRPREVRAGARARRGQVQGRARQRRRQGAHPGRHGAGQAGRRERDAELLHQRPQPGGRAAVREVQGDHRRRPRRARTS